MGINLQDFQIAVERDLDYGYPLDLSMDNHYTPVDVARFLLRRNILKKFLGAVTPEANQRALDKFLACNRECADWCPSRATTEDEQIFMGTLRKVLWNFVNPKGFELINHPATVMQQGMIGPGASVGVKGTDAFSKLYSSRLSCSDPKLYTWYTAFFNNHPTHLQAESRRCEVMGDFEVVDGSSITFVAKTIDETRTIATEPLLNMIYQQGIRAVLEPRLKYFFGIDLKTQQAVNREMARRGSIDGSLATIDLSSASDTISTRLVEHLFKGTDFLEYMRLGRCKSTRVLGQVVELNMWSTMGNAFTFPLQTAIFAATVVSCARLHFPNLLTEDNEEEGTKLNWGVNGDDIIVPTEMFEHVCRYLTLLGFHPNATKSFSQGRFRESCGGDFYEGIDVRAVYLERLDNAQDFYVAINRLNAWSAKTGWPLPRTMRWLKKQVVYRPVPLHYPVHSGIRTPLEFVKQGVSLNSNDSFVFKALVPEVKQFSFNEEGVSSHKHHIENPSGAYMCFLRGDVTDSRVSLRLPQGVVPRFKPRKQVSPNWDTPDASDRESDQWRGWNSPVRINMRTPKR